MPYLFKSPPIKIGGLFAFYLFIGTDMLVRMRVFFFAEAKNYSADVRYVNDWWRYVNADESFLFAEAKNHSADVRYVNGGWRYVNADVSFLIAEAKNYSADVRYIIPIIIKKWSNNFADCFF